MVKKIRVKVKEKRTEQIEISTDFIRLDSFLKLCNAVMTGGHAKIVIQDSQVKVNGEICLQRGKKLREADSIEFENVVYQIIKSN